MPVSWTTPRNWNAGDLVTASDMNIHLRDNLEWLKTPPTTSVSLAASVATTSTSFVNVTGLSITLTTVGGRVLLSTSFSARNDTAAQVVTFTLSIDGVDQGDTVLGLARYQVPVASYDVPVTMVFITPALAAGSHTFNVRFKVSANTGTVLVGAQFFAREV